MRKQTCVAYIVIILLGLACNKDNPVDGGKFPCGGIDPGIVPEPAYDSPIWHPSGQFIGFNHTPLVSITYPYGQGCWGEQHFRRDSAGFWLINPEGTNMRRTFPYKLQSPAWSPDGKWIAFVAGKQIYKMRFTGSTFDTTTVVQLTSQGRNFFPSWSPDMQWIVHDRTYAYPESSSVQGIWLLSADGTTRSKISTGRYPSWSPDGKDILFIDWFDSVKGGIIRYERQTSIRTLILDAAGIALSLPKYSPDGRTIVFCSNNNLWLIDSTGNNQQQLTTSEVDVSFGLPFSWSPDGSKIIYTRYQSTDWTMKNGVLWMIDISTKKETRLTFNP